MSPATVQVSMLRFYLSCLLAFTGGHMVNYTVILYLQEKVGSDWLSGVGFGLSFGSSIVFGWFAGVLCDRIAPARMIGIGMAKNQRIKATDAIRMQQRQDGSLTGIEPLWRRRTRVV